MVFELHLEPEPRGAMVRPLCKYAADVCSKGYKPEQMLLEEPLSLIHATAREYAACCRELEGSILEFGKFQNVKRLGDRKEVIDFRRKRPGQMPQAPPPAHGGAARVSRDR
jgi:hypothetical protein